MYTCLIVLTSLLLLFFAGYAFYLTFKKYEEDDDLNFTGLTWIEFLFTILLFISEKISPKKYHIMIFKVLSFLLGLFFLGLIVLLWILID